MKDTFFSCICIEYFWKNIKETGITILAFGEKDEGCEMRDVYFNVYHFTFFDFLSGAFKNNVEENKGII